MNPSIHDMLPPQAVASMIRGGASPTSLFPQNPLAQGQLPGSAGFDPALQQQPQMPVPQVAGGPAPMPGQPPMPQPGGAPMPGAQPAAPAEQDEAMMLAQVLADRLAHHSKITEKTVSAIINQMGANAQVSPPTA